MPIIFALIVIIYGNGVAPPVVLAKFQTMEACNKVVNAFGEVIKTSHERDKNMNLGDVAFCMAIEGP